MPSGPNPDITLREVCYHEWLEWLETFCRWGVDGSWKEDGDVWFQKFCLPDRVFQSTNGSLTAVLLMNLCTPKKKDHGGLNNF